LREPTVDEGLAEGEDEANDNERVAVAIWEATGELASASQDAVEAFPAWGTSRRRAHLHSYKQYHFDTRFLHKHGTD
jgi:hypothetical protein